MKKDIEWLKNEILGLSIKARHKENNQREWHMGHEMALFDVNKLINQLDEPETLSQDWIDENKVARIDNLRKMTTSDVVTVEKLKNLLVPKQDKPVIPQFVADFIEKAKSKDYSLAMAINSNDMTWIFKREWGTWLYEDEKEELFARAWLDGYEVEKEPVWVVSFTHDVHGNRNYFCGFTTRWGLEKDNPFCPNGYKNKDARGIIKFTDKAKAEAVAILVDGEVEEVTE